LQSGDTIAYTYDYTSTGVYAALSELAVAGTTITATTTPVTSFTLATPAFSLFVFVQDLIGAQPVSLIANGTVTATCNAGGTTLTMNSAGYFKLATACTGDLTIHNTNTSEVLYTTTPPATILLAAQLTRFVYPTIRVSRANTLTSEVALNAQVFIWDATNGNLTYDTTNWCITNASQITMLVCTTRKAIVNPSIVNFKVWLVAYGITVDTIIGATVSVSTSNVAILPLTYEFKCHYFALVDQTTPTPNNVTSGITLNVGTPAATLSAQTGYSFYYDSFVSTSVTI
jgi:hypothetical protein